MDNKKAIYVSIALCIIFSVISGVGIYKYSKRKTISNGITIKQFGNSGEKVDNKLVETSVKDQIISPNAKLVMIQKYKKCGHTTENVFSVPEDIINMDRKQIQMYYFGWNVEKFSSSELVISKENSGICDEHYIARDVEGCVNVYCLDNNNSENLVYSTDIETKYLPEEDREKLKKGIGIVGKENLSALLEDYE